MKVHLKDRPGEPRSFIWGIWDTATGKELHTIQRGQWDSVLLNFSRDARWYAAGVRGADGTNSSWTVKVWESATGKEVWSVQLPGEIKEFNGVCFAPDGARVAVGMTTGEGDRRQSQVKLWSVADGRELLTIPGPPGRTTSFGFTPDGKRMILICETDSESGYLGVWDAATGREVFREKGPFPNAHGTCSHDGTRFVCIGNRLAATVWDINTGRLLQTLKTTDGVSDAAFTRDDRYLVTVGRDRSVRTWDATASDAPVVLKGQVGSVTKVALSVDATHVATVSQLPDGKGHEVCVWDQSGQQLPPVLALPPFPSFPVSRGWLMFEGGLALNQDGRLAAVARGASSQPGEGPLGDPRRPGELRVWETTTGQDVFRVSSAAPFDNVALSPDGRLVAANVVLGKGEQGAPETVVRVWDVATREELRSFPGASALAYCRASALAFSRDGRRLATVKTSAQSAVVKVWDVATGREVHSHQEAGGVPSSMLVVLSPDGEKIAWVRDSALKVQEVGTGRPPLACRGHTGYIEHIAFTPDGRRIASAAAGFAQNRIRGEVKIWDSASGNELLSLKVSDLGRLQRVGFSLSGHRLFAVGEMSRDQPCAIKVWDATPRGPAVADGEPPPAPGPAKP